MVIIEIRNQQKRIPLHAPQIIKIARKILKHEGVLKAHLSIVFVTDRKIKALNKRFLKRNHPTDVLAFDWLKRQKAEPCLPCPSGRAGRDRRQKIDGEIIISTVTACHNAKRFKTSPYGEVLLYVVHGILHLLGYDDHHLKDRKKMRAKEKELMGLICS